MRFEGRAFYILLENYDEDLHQAHQTQKYLETGDLTCRPILWNNDSFSPTSVLTRAVANSPHCSIYIYSGKRHAILIKYLYIL